MPDFYFLGAHIVSRRITTMVLLAAVALLLPAAAQATERVSSNWAGYVAASAHPRREPFSNVSGTWVVPATMCSAGHQTYSAVWVGLGGYRASTESLEQTGTEQDCNHAGDASYSAWYEILPAAPVTVHLEVRPGDTIEASTTVVGHAVTFHIRDLTSGAHYATTHQASKTNVSTAEWIVEAPSACSTNGLCEPLPLASVGTVNFDSATAKTSGQTGTAGSAAWSDTTLKLEQESISLPSPSSFRSEAQSTTNPTRTIVTAAPSAASAPYGSFSVSLTEQATELTLPSVPTLPGVAR